MLFIELFDVNPFYFFVLTALICTSIYYIIRSVFIKPGLVDVTYGKLDEDSRAIRINPRLGWLLMESPALLCFLWFVYDDNMSTAAIVVSLMWVIHYTHRSLIYPLQLNVSRKRPGLKLLSVVGLGGLFCGVNGYLNGLGIREYAPHLETTDWLYSPLFIGGIMVYVVGTMINKHSDYVLASLRKEIPEGQYGIPNKGLFKYVSSANYLGELLIWLGFALSVFIPAAWMFLLFSMCNLVPRAISSHAWYHSTFKNYPKNRKIIIPFLY